jgi:hypothetical protein
VSAGIQAATFGLSLYHALIILQLSWINSMTFMTVHFVARAAQSIKAQRETSSSEGFSWIPKMNLWKLLRSPEALVSSMHFIVVGGIGIWVWRHIQTFGDQAECNQDTFLVILSKTVYGEFLILLSNCDEILRLVSVAHGPVIRRVSLALYGISLVPLGNIYVMGGILGVVAAFGRLVLFCLLIIPGITCGRSIFLHIFPRRPSTDDEARTDEQRDADIVQSRTFGRLTFYFAISGMAVTMIILIANTEQMIHRSSRLVQPGEGDWTFGQTLTLLLLFLPIWDAVEAIRGKDDEEC